MLQTQRLPQLSPFRRTPAQLANRVPPQARNAKSRSSSIMLIPSFQLTQIQYPKATPSITIATITTLETKMTKMAKRAILAVRHPSRPLAGYAAGRRAKHRRLQTQPLQRHPIHRTVRSISHGALSWLSNRSLYTLPWSISSVQTPTPALKCSWLSLWIHHH